MKCTIWLFHRSKFRERRFKNYLQANQDIGTQSVQELFFVIVAFVELFTVMIWLNVHQERNWKFMMTLRCYIGNGKMAKIISHKMFD